MTVLHIITDLNRGGAEMMLLKLLTATDRRSTKSVVVSLMSGGVLVPDFERLGVPTYALGMTARRPTPAALKRLVDIAKRHQPDVLSGWMYHSNLAALTLRGLLRSKAPVVWNVRHALDRNVWHKATTSLTIAIGARLSSRVQAVVYNSRNAAFQHERAGYDASKSCLVPNGFDCRRLAPDGAARRATRESLGLDDATPLVGLVARYHPHKGHANFVAAAGLLSQADPRVRYALVGRDVDSRNSELVGLMERAGVADRMHLLGERCDVEAVTSAFDIAVSSSATEAFPNAIGEAMAKGIPCVVTDVGDSGYLVGDTGQVVPSGEPRRLANACLTLLQMQQGEFRALGEAARRRVVEHFSIDRVAGQFEALHREVLTVPGKERESVCAA